MGKYIIDGYDIEEAFKVGVELATGLDIIPKVKDRDKHSWPEESGVEIDTSTRLTFDAQDISLSCFVSESTYGDCIKRINGLINMLSDDGLHLLGSQLRNRLYPVLLQSVSDYSRVNPAGSPEVFVYFKVNLICPLPECRMGSATVLASGQVSLTANTGKQVTVWWGDGNTSTGTGALTHTYTNAGTYTILYAGTGVTSTAPTVTGITVDEYSYPASGDITHITVSPTSGEAFSKAIEAYNIAISNVNEYEKQLTLEGDYANVAFSAVTLSAISLTNNRCMLVPYIPKISFNCKQATFEVSTGLANSFARICIFGSTNKRPYTKLFQGQSFDCSVAEQKVDGTIDFNFIANTLYWIGLHSSLTPGIRTLAGYTCPKIKNSGSPNAYNLNYIHFLSTYSNGLPNNLEGIVLNYAYANIPFINFKVTSLL